MITPLHSYGRRHLAVFLAILAIALSVGAIGGSSARASGTPWCLDTSSGTQTGCYTDYASAEAAWTSGSIIVLPAGTTASGSIEVTKSVTIKGAGEGQTTLDLSGATSYGIHAAVDGVTIEDLTIQGPTNTSAGYGIKLEGANLHGTSTSNDAVTHVTVQGSYRTGIDLNGINGATLSNVTSTGASHGNGIGITDSHGITLSGVTTSGNAWGGVALYVKGSYYPCGTSSVSLSNLSLGETSAVYTGIDGSAAGCTITGLSVPTGYLPYKVTLAQSDPQDIYVKNLSDASSVANASSSLTPVMTSTSDGSYWVTSGFKLQDAVNAASAGGTVHVAAGTYAEGVTVNKGLTLKGSQTGVDARTRSGSESVLKSVSISSSNVTVDGFTFNGAAEQVNINSPTTLSGIVVSNDIFGGYGDVGLTGYDAGNVLVKQNLFNAPSGSGEAMQLRASSVAGGCNDSTVQNNKFNGATTNGGADVNFSCTGSNSSGITVSGNVSTGTSGGSSFIGLSGVTGLATSNNTATTDGSTVFVFGDITGTWTSTNDSFTSTAGKAISVHAADITSDPVNSGTIDVEGATLSGSPALGVSSGALNSNSVVKVHGSSITGGVSNASGVRVDATGNWWGSATAPTFTNVDTSSPCVNSTCTTPSSGGGSSGGGSGGDTGGNTGGETSGGGSSGGTTTSTTTTTTSGTATTTVTPTGVTVTQTGTNQPATTPVLQPTQSGTASVVVESSSGGTTAPAPVPVQTTWPANTFTVPVTVAIEPKPELSAPTSGNTNPPAVAGGFALGNAVVQIVATDSAGQKVTTLQAPMKIHVGSPPGNYVPAYSQDGSSWTSIPQLSSPELPAGQSDGYFVNADGSIDIYTRHLTYFTLLKDVQAPSKPVLKLQLQSSKLYMTKSSKDNVRMAFYVITLNGKTIKKTPRGYLSLSAATGTWRIFAVDTSGNKSAPAVFRVVRVTVNVHGKHHKVLRIVKG